MVRAKVVLAVGVLVVLGMFMLGTEKQWSAQVGGETYGCGPAIDASWLMSGATGPAPAPGTLTAEQPRVATACGAVTDRSHVLVLGAMGAGGLLALAGWGALTLRREPEELLALVGR